ncbi:hypothetical protein BD410DRAFT_89336 [Rickenella mellea]|uniref:DUF6535 domain-containing protein n=1 Tax=Rickenella mellea TaxID=50990 RepID=A0A4Y7QC71_9AGAM|nr:hypothetical protein BD410DRAFT_89336 [Rickenella mellea]
MPEDLESNRIHVNNTTPSHGSISKLTRALGIEKGQVDRIPSHGFLPPAAEIPISTGGDPTANRAGSDAEIWKTYITEAVEFDKSVVDSWNEDLDVLLIFAGLFSAVLTAFIIESRKDLQEDYQKTSAALLRTLATNAVNGTHSTLPQAFRPAGTALWVNALWFSSLGFSLIGALAAMLGKQWVRHYSASTSGAGTHIIRARRHQSGLIATQRWHISQAIHVIPIPMHIALFLFFTGLFPFLWSTNTTVFTTIASISVLCLIFYGTITALPMLFADCPYQTPFSPLLPVLRHKGTDNKEHLDTQSLLWLMKHSSNSNSIRASTMAISGVHEMISVQMIIHDTQAMDVLANVLASCIAEQQGFLVIRRSDLDTASLVLLAATRLLKECVKFGMVPKFVSFIRRLDPSNFLDIRPNFDSADCSAALWCLVALRDLNRIISHTHSQYPNRSSADLMSRLPVAFRPPASSRVHTDMLPPLMKLVQTSANDDPQLFAWAAEAMIDTWRFEGCPGLGDSGNSVLSVAAIAIVRSSDSKTLDRLCAVTKVESVVHDICSAGAVERLAEYVAVGSSEDTANLARDTLVGIVKNVKGR